MRLGPTATSSAQANRISLTGRACVTVDISWTCPGLMDTWVMPLGAADATDVRRPAD
jgi:hypothetical protein